MTDAIESKGHRRLVIAMRVLLVMILTLMALGASVRAMHAGLSCPDWPLCFGKVIPDFHPGVWFEFVHRAYAGLTGIFFFILLTAVLLSRRASKAAKGIMIAGGFCLLFLIAAGALTVLWQVRWFAVTAHLVLATLFFSSVFVSLLLIDSRVQKAQAAAPKWIAYSMVFLSLAVFAQIFLGGVVASTYAGSVCVDWPLCNGQWVPTWRGAIGHQVIHRFVAYFLTVVILALAIFFQVKKDAPWMTRQLLSLSRVALAVVVFQVVLGVANLLLYIPPWITVPHQSVAVILMATCLRLTHVSFVLASEKQVVRVPAGSASHATA